MSGNDGSLKLMLVLLLTGMVIVTVSGFPSSNSTRMMGGGGGSTSPNKGTTPAQQPRASGIKQVSLSSHEEQQVESTMANYYEKLPSNHPERRKQTVAAATKLCNFDQNYSGALNVSTAGVNASSNISTKIHRFDYAAQITNEHFNDELDRTAISKTRNVAGDVGKYAPLAASYNQMAKDACAVKASSTNETIESFYKSSLYFGVEFSLIQAGVFYKPAFAGTRYISNTAGLYRIRSLCGNRCYALALSEVHWGLRATPIGLANYINRNNENLSIARSTEINLTSIAKEQEWDNSVNDLQRLYSNTKSVVNNSEMPEKIGDTISGIENQTKDRINVSINGTDISFKP